MAHVIVSVCVLLIVAVTGVLSDVDYCDLHTFANYKQTDNDHRLHFNKENAEKEYAIVGRFKSLHCCARGYRSIEWYKDGVAYPWGGSLILYPEAANQTVYTYNFLEGDAGNYSCLVSNDIIRYKHNVQVFVLDTTEYTSKPLPTYKLKNQRVDLGDTMRFFCEAFVGHIPLPDAHNEVTWSRQGVNMTKDWLSGRFLQKDVLRERKQVLGSYLIVTNVQESDLGAYNCTISNMVFQALSMTALLSRTETVSVVPNRRVQPLFIFIAIAYVVLAIFLILFFRFRTQIRLWLRDCFGAPEENDGKQLDATLIYDRRNGEFVLAVLVPKLENFYGYRVAAHSVHTLQIDQWPEDVKASVKLSRRLIAVLSPQMMRHQWTAESLLKAICMLETAHPGLICLALKSLPNSTGKTDEERALHQLLNRISIVELPSQVSRTLWPTLRLALPCRRRPVNPPRNMIGASTSATSITSTTCCGSSGSNVTTSSSRRLPKATSNESLEVLV